MAEKFGNFGECLSQKRSWVDCQSPGEKSDISEDSHALDPPLLFPKRSRSEQEFVKKEDLQRSASDVMKPGCEINSSHYLTAPSCQPQNSHHLHTEHDEAVSFTIGPGEQERESTNGDKHDSDLSEHRNGQNSGNSSELLQSFDIEEASDTDEFSESNAEDGGWRPLAGPLSWVQRQMSLGIDPREILKHILPHHTSVPADLDQLMLWKLIINILSEPPPRKKLKHINTLDQVINLINECKNIIILTGAGVSVSCGIPDFRSQDGIYARLSIEYPDLPDPQAMFDIHYFHHNQKPFFKFAKEIYPGQFEPSRSHKFIRLIEEHGKLLRNYTQNIDTLEQVAGIKNVIQCHGSFATATCMACKYKTNANGIRADIMNQVVPRCPRCPPEEPLAILKPDIVFFGESLPSEFHNQMDQDKDVCDLLIVIGSSLKVRPVALIPNSLPKNVPQILINREPLKHLNFDVELLGDCDVIVQELCKRLDPSWQSICSADELAVEINYDDMLTPSAQSPIHHPTPPNSEESTRMSFQMSSDDNNSRMSTSQSTASTSQAESAANLNDQSKVNIGFNLCPTKEDSSMSFEDSETKYSESSETPASSSSHTTNTATTLSSDTSRCTLPQMKSAETENAGNENEKEHMALLHEANESNRSTNLAQVSSDITRNLDSFCSQRQLEELRACWQPKFVNLASRLKEDTYLFLPPNRYVFKGAEVYDNLDSDTDTNTDDSSTGSSSSLNTLEQDIDESVQKPDCRADDNKPDFESNTYDDSGISSSTTQAVSL